MGNTGRRNERNMKTISNEYRGVNFKIILIIFWTPTTFVELISVVISNQCQQKTCASEN